MCAILDTCAAHEVFGSDAGQATEAGKGFFRWLNDGKGGLIVGGKLQEELKQVPNYRALALQATLSGKLVKRIASIKRPGKSAAEVTSNQMTRTLSPWHR